MKMGRAGGNTSKGETPAQIGRVGMSVLLLLLLLLLIKPGKAAMLKIAYYPTHCLAHHLVFSTKP